MCVVALLGGERFVSGGWAKTGAVKAIFESENGGAREKGQKQSETVSRAKRKRGRATTVVALLRSSAKFSFALRTRPVGVLRQVGGWDLPSEGQTRRNR